MTKPRPKGIYLVAVVFFFAGLLCMAQLLLLAFDWFGISPILTTRNLQWRLPAYLLLLGLDLVGVYLLVRLRPAGKWLMLAMTVFLTAVLLMTPAAATVFYSQPRLYVNRILLLLPMIASCVYLWRLQRQ